MQPQQAPHVTEATPLREGEDGVLPTVHTSRGKQVSDGAETGRLWARTTGAVIGLLAICLIGGIVLQQHTDKSKSAAYSSSNSKNNNNGNELPGTKVQRARRTVPTEYKSCLDYEDEEVEQIMSWNTHFQNLMAQDDFFEWFTGLPDIPDSTTSSDGFCMLSVSDDDAGDDEGRRLLTNPEANPSELAVKDKAECSVFSGELSGIVPASSDQSVTLLDGTCVVTDDDGVADDDAWWAECSADVDANVRLIRIGDVLCMGVAMVTVADTDIADSCDIDASLGGSIGLKVKIRYDDVTYKKVFYLVRETTETSTDEIVFTRTKTYNWIEVTFTITLSNEGDCEYDSWSVWLDFSYEAVDGDFSNTISTYLGILDYTDSDDD